MKKTMLLLSVLAVLCAHSHAATATVSRAVMVDTNNSVKTPGFWASNTFHGAGTTGIIFSASGDAGKFLKADGTWGTPAGGGGGSGVSSVDIGTVALGTGDIKLGTASTNATGMFAGWLIASTGITVTPSVSPYGSTNYTIAATGGGGGLPYPDAGGAALENVVTLALGGARAGTARFEVKGDSSTQVAARLTDSGGTGDGIEIGCYGGGFIQAFNRISNTYIGYYFSGSSIELRANNVNKCSVDDYGAHFPSGVFMSSLPTRDPSNSGQLWNDAGTVKVSAGSP